MNRKGSLFILSGPSGVGKDSIARQATSQTNHVTVAGNYTTRLPRPGEEAGSYYRFVTPAEFFRKAEYRELLGIQNRNRVYYGMDRDHITDMTEKGYDVLALFSDYPKVNDLQEEAESCGIETGPATLVLADLTSLRRRVMERNVPDDDKEPRLYQIERDIEYFLSEDFRRDLFDCMIWNGDDVPLESSTYCMQAVIRHHRGTADDEESDLAESLQKRLFKFDVSDMFVRRQPAK